MADFKIDPIDGDLDLTAFDMVLTDEDNGESLAQRLSVKLAFFKGEWVLNVNFGIPYFQEIFGKVGSKHTLDTIFRNQILATPDVVEILEFESSLDKAARTYDLTTLTVEGKTGAIIEINTLRLQV